MRLLLAILVLFAGFALLLLGGFLVFGGLLPLDSHRRNNPCWPLVGIGLLVGSSGWMLRRVALARLPRSRFAKEKRIDL